MRALEADGFRRPSLLLLLVAVLFGAWATWFFRARVSIYEVSDQARLEIDQAIYPIDALLTGRTVTSNLTVGRSVQAGEVLVELNAGPQQLQHEEELTRLAAIEPQLRAVRAEMAAEQQALGKSQETARAAVEQAHAQYEEAESRARLAELEEERFNKLSAAGVVAEQEMVRVAAEAKSRRAAAESLRAAISRMESDYQTQVSDRKVRLERLNRDATQLEGERTTVAATIRRLEEEIERRQIRAPVSGRLGEAAALRVGAVVREGDKLGTVVPSGNLRVVAEFPPPAALGRLREGQPARLRLSGFPWTQYGSIAATVATVASEIRDGHVRVELAIHPDPSSAVPFQHGLPGTVEVEVERIAPVALVLRAAGGLITRPVSWVSNER